MGERKQYAKGELLRPYHIEEDFADSSQLVLSTYCTVSTVREDDTQITPIVGLEYLLPYYREREFPDVDARFNKVTGFVQVRHSTRIIVVDHKNHCLRYVDRDTSYTGVFAGSCTNSGSSDGDLLEARFNKPYNVIAGYYRDEYYVTDTFNSAVRLIRDSRVTKIAYLDDDQQPRGIALDRPNRRLLITANSNIYTISIDDSGVQTPKPILTSQQHDFKKIIALASDLYLVSNWGTASNSVLLLNTDNVSDQVKPLVSGSKEDFRPYSIALSSSRNKLYIGLEGLIQVMTVRGRFVMQVHCASVDCLDFVNMNISLLNCKAFHNISNRFGGNNCLNGVSFYI